MSDALAYLTGMMGVCQRDVQLFRTYPSRLLATLFTTAVNLSLFFYISRLVGSRAFRSPNSYYAYVVVGMVILAVLTSTIATPLATLRQELLTGTFERLVLSPLGPVAGVLSLMVFPLALSVLVSLFTIGFAAVAFGLQLHWPSAAAGLPVALLAAVSFAPFGLLMAAGTIMLKQAYAGATFIITGLTVVSGVYFPVVLLPHWIRWLSDVQPFTPAVSLLRHVLVNTPLAEPAALSLLKLIGFPAVLVPLSARLLHDAVERSRRRGTLTEY